MPKAKKQDHYSSKNPAEKILTLLTDFKLEAIPENYQLFHSYVTGDNPKLADEMRPLINERVLDQTSCSILHNRHFQSINLVDQTLEAGDKFGKEVGSVLRLLAAAERNTVEYEKTLSGATDILENGSDPKSLKSMVDTLLVATTKMQQRTHSLEAKLNKTTAEVSTLRTNLEQVRTESMTDSLTGIANRKRFDEFMQNSCQAAQKGEDEQQLSLVFCDIDHFKRFNDTWGHQTGDQIIRFVAGCLQRHSSKTHLVARYGGEEFAVVMPYTDAQTAFDLADNVRATVESKKLLRKSTNEDLGTVTISLGVANFLKGESVEEFIGRADEALYHSKNDGRNKVSISSNPKNDRNAA